MNVWRNWLARLGAEYLHREMLTDLQHCAAQTPDEFGWLVDTYRRAGLAGWRIRLLGTGR